jgi:hypothetical protein
MDKKMAWICVFLFFIFPTISLSAIWLDWEQEKVNLIITAFSIGDLMAGIYIFLDYISPEKL